MQSHGRPGERKNVTSEGRVRRRLWCESLAEYTCALSHRESGEAQLLLCLAVSLSVFSFSWISTAAVLTEEVCDVCCIKGGKESDSCRRLSPSTLPLSCSCNTSQTADSFVGRRTARRLGSCFQRCCCCSSSCCPPLLPLLLPARAVFLFFMRSKSKALSPDPTRV